MRILEITHDTLGSFRESLDVGDYVVGRHEEADIRLDSLAVSASHARLRVLPDGLLVEDLGSSNGVSLDGVPVSNICRVRSGQVIGIGDVAMRVVIGTGL